MKGIRARLRIKGLVQGVYFRSYMQEVAERFNVNGWVKNCPDRTVEAVLEGSEENVKKVIDWAQRGPPAAKITDVDVEWEDYIGEFKNFRIEYF
ncbi:MAG: acylphosphatase [Candidatus Subteraquimicrobiales bacterium]|nr:acylphosphatase [Candidatus Subteraquimicrobiales bacterium]